MSAEQQLKLEIYEAIMFLRENNNTIPSETIEFMKQASLEKLKTLEPITYWFQCTDKDGGSRAYPVRARSPEEARNLVEIQHPECVKYNL